MIIDEIKRDIAWLKENSKSNNILEIAIVLDHLAILTTNLGELTADAYDLMSDTEEDYNDSITEYTSNFQGSAAKAGQMAKAEFIEKKRLWTEAKKTYNRYKIWIGRIDKVLDTHKQRVSVEKQTGVKHMSGNT